MEIVQKVEKVGNVALQLRKNIDKGAVCTKNLR